MKFILFFLLALISTVIYSQEKNPFDISISDRQLYERILEKNSEDVLIQDSTKADNPFNVAKSAPVIADVNKKTVNTTIKSPKRFSVLSMIVSFIGLILVTIGINVDRSRFTKLVKSFYNFNALKGLYRSKKSLITLQDGLLYTGFFINVSLFIYLAFREFLVSNRFSSWWSVILTIGLIYLIRHLAQNILSYTYLFTDQSNQHGFSIMTHNIIVGIAILPILIGLQFGPENNQFLVYLGIFLLGLGYLLRQGKGLLLGLSVRGFNVMYFFIYLCAVEIAPMLILLKELR